jgi:hypothetical protein
MQFSAVLFNAMQCCAVQFSAVQDSAIQLCSELSVLSNNLICRLLAFCAILLCVVIVYSL